VNGDNALHIQLQAFDMGDQALSVGADHSRGLREQRSGRIEAIGLDQHPLFWKVHEQHPCVMPEIGHVIQLDDMIAVSQGHLVFYRFERGFLGVLRQAVRSQRVGSLPYLFVVGLVDFLGDDRRAFGYLGAQPSGMVNMRMRVHQFGNSLDGHQALGFGDHGLRPLVALAALDY